MNSLDKSMSSADEKKTDCSLNQSDCMSQCIWDVNKAEKITYM